MTTLPGYQLTSTLYEGTRTLVERGTRTTDNQPVVIKFLRNEYPTFSELVQFRNQYTITKNLDLPGIVRPLALLTHGNGYALVMEDLGGISLREYCQLHSLELTEFLAVALQITEILHGLYHNRVIHKDLKPANILIHPESKQIQLIDFSIASLLPKETEEVKHPNVLEGTLAYLAPEQTGRMNRGIDYRADFYSLGVTLFELLTGELPFPAEDPMELVHCHLAKSAPSVCELQPEIPVVIGQIVTKLMAKNAEDRYQSALGLKQDLEICLYQFKETGQIQEFEIGTKDLCDRFIIPEKLYGRETEVKTLLNAFERVSQGTSEFMLVAGFSGIGKTAVVNEVHKPITRQRGYFIKGKFDQFNRNIPFSAFAQALRDLMRQLMSESDEQLQAWKTQILEAVGDSGQVLIEVIPELEWLIGVQPPVPELSGTAAQNRFNLLFQKFIAVFTTAEHPLVLFLDDLQWADSASLGLIKLLMEDRGYLLLLGAYRDNEVSPVHPFMLTVDELVKTGATVKTITLPPLHLYHLDQMVADTLGCQLEVAQPLSKWVYQKTQGNPFFTTQFLKGLHQDGYITFDYETGVWQCDLAQVRSLSLTDDVVEFMADRLRKLPEETQTVLKFAACIGAQFDLNTLAIVSERSEADTAAALWKGLQEGLILPISETYKFFQSRDVETAELEISVPYKFLHDRVQQAAYSLIADNQKQSTHLKIGQLLLGKTLKEEMEYRIFDIVNQLNMGIELIDKLSQREQLARLNLTAGHKAKVATAYTAAVNYLTTGSKLLTSDSWKNQYEFTLKLYELLAESEYLNTNFEASKNLIIQIIKNAQKPLDKIKVYEIQVQSYTAQNKLVEAISTGREALSLLGVDFPQDCDFETMIAEHQKLKVLLDDRSIETLAELPDLLDSEQSGSLRILAGLFASVYLAKPELLPLKIFTMVKICLQFGNSPQSAIAYSLYGLFLCATGEIDRGYQFGQLGTSVLEKLQAKELASKINLLFGLFVKHWKTSIRSTLPVFLTGLTSGLENGDLEYVGYCANCYSQFLFWTGENLKIVEAEGNKYCDLIQSIKQKTSLIWANIWQQTVVNLRIGAENPTILNGSFFDEIETLPSLAESKNTNGICYVYLAKILLFYLFEDYQSAQEYAKKFEEYEQGAAGLLIVPLKNFYQSLSLISSFSGAKEVLTAVEFKKITDNQTSMKFWADTAPMNYLHKFQLVQAETHRILGENYEAGDLYDRAIQGAKANEYLQEEALANELAAKFYLNWGKEKVAAGYMQEAYYCYAKWGAKAKTDDLEKRYPQLLKPILQTANPSLTVLETLASVTNTNYSIHSTHTQSSSSSSLNNTFDFAALLQVSQALSSTIQLDELIQTLTQTMLENSGADKCALMLCQEGEWQVRAIANLQQTTLQIALLEDHTNTTVPVKLIQYVKNTLETIVVDNLQTDLPVMGNYLNQNKPKSVLCLPILNKGNLVGILYLENQLTSGVFTSDRILVLNFMCTQAAISLENARLYQKAQDYAQQLEQSQLQLVQSEKMSALGNLVAGVAHEINNPVGFIAGNLQPAKDYVQDLLELIDLYEEEYPQPSATIAEKIDEIDLEFIREDLPKLIGSMKAGTDRISHISTSLRTFSRADSDRSTLFNVHEGIDSTLLILKHRLKANELRPTIEVVKHYGNLLEINCFPGQLNQVFMNILANAIDALDECIDKWKIDQPGIQILTKALETSIVIQIKDNGMGMPAEVKAKIFEHLFTTKNVGKGTGLGLAIVRQIVVEKHGGILSCSSEVGKGTEFAIQLPLT